MLRRVSTVIAISSLALFFGCCAAAAAHADDDNAGGIGLTVVVGSPEPEIPGNSGGTVIADTGLSLVTPDAAEPAAPGAVDAGAGAGAAASDLGGIVYLSGLTAKSVWSGNILQSAAQLQFTVRNISTQKFDSSARFWAQTTAGNKVGSTPEVKILTLAPGETRTIRVKVTDLGQWAVLHAYVEFIPPPSVLGVALTPTQRDSFIFVPPVAVGGAGALGAAALLVGNTWPVGRLLRFRFGFSR